MARLARFRRERGEDLALLTAVARYVFEQHITQKDVPAKIEETFGKKISVSTVSRLLDRAVALGLVTTYVKPPRQLQLQEALLHTLAPKHVHTVCVVPRGVGNNEENLGLMGAEQLLTAIRAIGPSKTRVAITLSGGMTLWKVLKSFFTLMSPDIRCELQQKQFELYPAFLADDSGLEYLFPHTLIGEFGTNLKDALGPNHRGDRVTATLLTLPPDFYGCDETVRKRFLTAFPKIEAAIAKAKQADIFLLRIGALKHDGHEDRAYDAFLQRLDPMLDLQDEEYGVETFFIPLRADDGKEHATIRDKIIAVKISELRQLAQQPGKQVIVVAGGKSKCRAIKHALENPYFNVLVTDEDVAEFLVEQT